MVGEEIRHKDPETSTNRENLIYAQLTPLHILHPHPPEAKGYGITTLTVPLQCYGLDCSEQERHQQRRSRVSEIKETIKGGGGYQV